jgi:mono/diheme cytochrome c family protein
MSPKRTPRSVTAPALVLVALGLAALGAGPWKAPEDTQALVNPKPAGPDSVAAGRRVYENKCLGCHGPTGNGDGPDVEDLGIHPARLSDPSTQVQTDGELFWKIKTGRRPMPSYGKRLSSDDIWNAVHYVRSFAPGPAPGK